MEPKREVDLLKGIPPGRLGGLSSDRSRVVATGDSYGEFVDRADEAGTS